MSVAGCQETVAFVMVHINFGNIFIDYVHMLVFFITILDEVNIGHIRSS